MQLPRSESITQLDVPWSVSMKWSTTSSNPPSGYPTGITEIISAICSTTTKRIDYTTRKNHRYRRGPIDAFKSLATSENPGPWSKTPNFLNQTTQQTGLRAVQEIVSSKPNTNMFVRRKFISSHRQRCAQKLWCLYRQA